MAVKETGLQLLARLGSRPSIEGIQPVLFDKGPNTKDVIEIYGAEGTGKTELLYHIVVACILPKEWKGHDLGGCDAGVIFIDTDYKFSVLRITALIEKHVTKKLGNSKIAGDSVAMETFVRECLKKLHIVRCSSSSQLVITLHSLENLVCCDTGISVIMIDSISAFYWIDKFSGGDSTQAQEANMKLISSILGKLVNMYNLILFATKSQVYKKKLQDIYKNVRDSSQNVRDIHQNVRGTVQGADKERDLEEEHLEFMCKAWQRLISHRLVCVQVPSSSESPPALMVGGDVTQGNSSFTIKDSGVKFDKC